MGTLRCERSAISVPTFPNASELTAEMRPLYSAPKMLAMLVALSAGEHGPRLKHHTMNVAVDLQQTLVEWTIKPI